jgi:hypothetical protein
VLGFTGALTGQLAVLLVVLGIFFGTLSLGKMTAASKASVEERP